MPTTPMDNIGGGNNEKSIHNANESGIIPYTESLSYMGPTRMILSKPVIAAVSGYAVAGGLELALWADLRVADETAKFGVFCRRFGVPLIDGGTVRFVSDFSPNPLNWFAKKQCNNSTVLTVTGQNYRNKIGKQATHFPMYNFSKQKARRLLNLF